MKNQSNELFAPLAHPYLKSMFPPYRRLLHLSASLPIGINPHAKDNVDMRLALAHGDMRTIKEVVARNIILKLIASGKLRPGDTAIDATSGGTGIGYAGILQPLGIYLKLVVKSSLPHGKMGQLLVYGGGVELIPHSGPGSTVDRSRQEAEKNGYVLLDQYGSEANPEAHETYTAPELWNLTNGEVDVIIIALGTTGTMIGFSRYFKQRNRNVRIIGVAVDPNQEVPQIPGMRTLQEIKDNVRLHWNEKGVVDEIRLALRADAVRGSRLLAYAEPSWPGLSTGALLNPALAFVAENLQWLYGKRVILISADSIGPYMDIMQAEQDDADIENALLSRPAF